MATRYACDNSDRRALLLESGERLAINAIDYLEVVDSALTDAAFRQRLLLVRFLRPLAEGGLAVGNVSIAGGTTVTSIQVGRVFRLTELESAWPDAPTAAREYLEGFAGVEPSESASWLVVVVDRSGDHSTYELRLIASAAQSLTPAGFDPVLTRVNFRFKVECPSPFDCREVESEGTRQDATAPAFDYLARDYQSFRRLMLDRLSISMPDWRERSPADLGVALVELLAYAADRAAYFQDAVATEAYLDTARLRTSVRRHARLLDYRMHEGCNARTWVHLEVTSGTRRDDPDNPLIRAGTRFLTGVGRTGTVLTEQEASEALDAKVEVFEALHPMPVWTQSEEGKKEQAHIVSFAHNEIHFHTWGESTCVLPAGATSAALKRPDAPCADAARPDAEAPARPHREIEDTLELELKRGDVLVFEPCSAEFASTAVAGAAELRRHVVRLVDVGDAMRDELCSVRYWQVTWHVEDALPFPLCLQRDGTPATVARGNIVLADHGRTWTHEALVPAEAPTSGRYRPRLMREDLTWCARYLHEEGMARAASTLCVQSPNTALPTVSLLEGTQTWTPKADLLESDAFVRGFVVEMEGDGRAWLRFGDGVLGQKPTPGASMLVTYRTGNGSAGNIGANALQRVVADQRVQLKGIVSKVSNPLPAVGGVDPEPLQTVKLQAPAAFKVQMRAVTAEDWAAVAERHPKVQRAVARLRWTGSWQTVYITVDPVGGVEFAELRGNLLEFLAPFRMAGVDLELRSPEYVPIDLALVVCVKSDHFAHEARAGIVDRLRAGTRRDGRPGYFHPDRLTFGQSVYLSTIVAEVMRVPGVAWVDLDPDANGREAVRFQRLYHPDHGELRDGVLPIAPLQVARLDNDPSAPDNGRLRLTMRGGR